MRVALDGVEVAIDGTVIVHGASIIIPNGAFVGVVGPNGSGKTTLMRTIYRSLRPAAGTVSIGDQDPWAVNSRRAAQLTAVVAQDSAVGFEFTVAEVAAMGRIPHKGSFDRETTADRHVVAGALAEVGMALAHRRYSTLSGGERQRVLIARALVQESPVLVLDEPTNHLDIRYQLDVLHRVRRLGLTTLAALHDLNLAAAWCDHVYVMHQGRVVAGGPPEEALDPALISDVFGVTAVSFRHPITGRHQLLFDRSDPTPDKTGVTMGDHFPLPGAG
ncbi:MAG: ABC transporter ATP-binding protein [Pseudonocardiaceae bacterium]